MADWKGISRSNYFKVKDLRKFKDWLATFDGEVELIEHEERAAKGFYGIVAPGGYWPMDRENPDTYATEVVEFRFELSQHLERGQVAVLLTVGWEKLKYVTGTSVAVAWDGQEVMINLDNIYDIAEHVFGVRPGRAEF